MTNKATYSIDVDQLNSHKLPSRHEVVEIKNDDTVLATITLLTNDDMFNLTPRQPIPKKYIPQILNFGNEWLKNA